MAASYPPDVVYRQVTIVDWRDEFYLKDPLKLSIVDNLWIILFAYALKFEGGSVFVNELKYMIFLRVQSQASGGV